MTVITPCERCSSEFVRTQPTRRFCSESCRAAARNERYNRKHYARRRETIRSTQLRAKYGITSEQYDRMLEAQGGVCAVCSGTHENGHRLAVDHCHTTGKVRSLLCGACNTALGLAKEDPTRLEALAAYLRLHQGGAL